MYPTILPLLAAFDLNEFLNGNGPILIILVVLVVMGKAGGNGTDWLTMLLNMLIKKPAPAPAPAPSPAPAPAPAPGPAPGPSPNPAPAPVDPHPVLDLLKQFGPIIAQLLLEAFLKKQAEAHAAAMAAAKDEAVAAAAKQFGAPLASKA